jgi:hypothetical protein
MRVDLPHPGNHVDEVDLAGSVDDDAGSADAPPRAQGRDRPASGPATPESIYGVRVAFAGSFPGIRKAYSDLLTSVGCGRPAGV